MRPTQKNLDDPIRMHIMNTLHASDEIIPIIQKRLNCKHLPCTV